jgi:hypothetical protein
MREIADLLCEIWVCFFGNDEYYSYIKSLASCKHQKGAAMNQEKREKGNQKKSQEKFNTVTSSVKPENQNQNHNVRKEGVGRQNNKYRDER